MILPDFKNANVLIVGDLMLDRYWGGSTGRISPEAPVPVVNVNTSEDRPGGAANVAINAAIWVLLRAARGKFTWLSFFL